MTTAASAVSSASPSPASSRFEPALAYRQSSDIGLRPEPFGALAYHFVTRRLVFLKSNELVDLVQALGEYPSAAAAIEAVIVPATPQKRTSYEKALASLLESGVIQPGAASSTTDDQAKEPTP